MSKAIDVRAACEKYAQDNEDAGGQVMQVTLVDDVDLDCEYTKDSWEDGVPVTKGFSRNGSVGVFIPAGQVLMGVTYTGRASGCDIFEFRYGRTWYRTYPVAGTIGTPRNELREVV